MTPADTARVRALEELDGRRSHGESNELQELYLKRWLRTSWEKAQAKLALAPARVAQATKAASIRWKFRGK